MKWKTLLPLTVITVFAACQKIDLDIDQNKNVEDLSTFTQISSTEIGGGEGAAEISAFDPKTNKLFVITNAGNLTQIEVFDITNPATPFNIGTINVSAYGGGVNSVDVSDGKLAAAIEGFSKTDNGKVVVFKTSDYSVISQVVVGALPDMVAFTPDGKYILTANEGEPSSDYGIDPMGTLSIISVKNNYAVTTLDFSGFASQESALKAKGFRIFGKDASFAEDIEPEYLTVSADSRTAWVTLQENNGIAKIDINSKKITQIFPLGFKNYSQAENYIDPSDFNKAYSPAQWNVKGIYMPDGIAVIEEFGIPFLFTANEGDAREYPDAGFVEIKRVKQITLDPIAFPNATVKEDGNLGRLNITTTLGDTDSDGDFDELYSYGSRSFSVWNGLSGKLLYDSKNELDEKSSAFGVYDDGRSDDKSVEPEAVVIGASGRQRFAFVGMERADAVAIYDLSSCLSPKFVKMLNVGDAPEGVIFVSAKDSPTKKSLLIVSNEGDGTVRIFETQ